MSLTPASVAILGVLEAEAYRGDPVAMQVYADALEERGRGEAPLWRDLGVAMGRLLPVDRPTGRPQFTLWGQYPGGGVHAMLHYASQAWLLRSGWMARRRPVPGCYTSYTDSLGQQWTTRPWSVSYQGHPGGDGEFWTYRWSLTLGDRHHAGLTSWCFSSAYDAVAHLLRGYALWGSDAVETAVVEVRHDEPWSPGSGDRYFFQRQDFEWRVTRGAGGPCLDVEVMELCDRLRLSLAASEEIVWLSQWRESNA